MTKCSHNRIKAQCLDYKRDSICIHNRRKSRCKECKIDNSMPYGIEEYSLEEMQAIKNDNYIIII